MQMLKSLPMKAPQGSHTVHFRIEAVGTNDQVQEKSVFLVPR